MHAKTLRMVCQSHRTPEASKGDGLIEFPDIISLLNQPCDAFCHVHSVSIRHRHCRFDIAQFWSLNFVALDQFSALNEKKLIPLHV